MALLIKKLSLIILLGLFISCNKPIEGNGDIEKKIITFEKFDQITVSGNFKIILQQNNTSSVRIEMDQNLIDNTSIILSKKTLTIKEKKEVSKHATTYNIYVSTPNLKKIVLNQNSSLLNNQSFKTGDILLEAYQNSTVNASFETKNFSLKTCDESKITLYGETYNFNVIAKEKGMLDAFNFEANEISIDATGDSELKIYGIKDINGFARNNATIKYREGNFTHNFKTEDQAEVIVIRDNPLKNAIDESTPQSIIE